MRPTFPLLMDAHGWPGRLDDTGQQILGLGDRDLRDDLQALENLSLAGFTFSDQRIEGAPLFKIKFWKADNRLPESVIVQARQPLFQFILIIKHHHALSVPKSVLETQICTSNAAPVRITEGSFP